MFSMGNRVLPGQVFILVTLHAATSAWAASPAGSNPQSRDHAFAKLSEKADQEGQVPVIVILDEGAEPPMSQILKRERLSSAAVRQRETEIGRTQDKVQGVLEGRRSGLTRRRFKFVPAMAIEADRATLQQLQSRRSRASKRTRSASPCWMSAAPSSGLPVHGRWATRAAEKPSPSSIPASTPTILFYGTRSFPLPRPVTPRGCCSPRIG